MSTAVQLLALSNEWLSDEELRFGPCPCGFTTAPSVRQGLPRWRRLGRLLAVARPYAVAIFLPVSGDVSTVTPVSVEPF